MSYRIIHNGRFKLPSEHTHTQPKRFLRLRGIWPGAVIECSCGDRFLLNDRRQWVETDYGTDRARMERLWRSQVEVVQFDEKNVFLRVPTYGDEIAVWPRSQVPEWALVEGMRCYAQVNTGVPHARSLVFADWEKPSTEDAP